MKLSTVSSKLNGRCDVRDTVILDNYKQQYTITLSFMDLPNHQMVYIICFIPKMKEAYSCRNIVTRKNEKMICSYNTSCKLI